MIVCLCHGVNDHKIRRVVEDGAKTVREVGRRCGAGTDCGSCRRQIKDVIESVEATQDALVAAHRTCSNARLPVVAEHARQP